MYIGMIMTSFLWDFLTNRVSKRTLMLLGLFADSLLNILSSTLDSFYLFLLVKFVTGTM